MATLTAQKMKFSITNFFSKCEQICSVLRIWSHLLKKSLMKNFIFCATSHVQFYEYELYEQNEVLRKIHKYFTKYRYLFGNCQICQPHLRHQTMQIVSKEWFIWRFPVDTGRKLNVHKTFNLHPVSVGLRTCCQVSNLKTNAIVAVQEKRNSFHGSLNFDKLRK